MSETIADKTNEEFRSSPRTAKPHRLEEHAILKDDICVDGSFADRGPEDTAASLALASLYPIKSQAVADQEEQAPPSNMPFKLAVGFTDVFVDDFIQVGWPRTHRTPTCSATTPAALHRSCSSPIGYITVAIS